jgi:hypothetical protein
LKGYMKARKQPVGLPRTRSIQRELVWFPGNNNDKALRVS